VNPQFVTEGQNLSWQRVDAVVDALHPAGFQLIGGSRIPMLVFGGQVKQGIDTRWHSHAVIAKTVIDVFGLGPFGVPRVDTSPSLAGRIDATLAQWWAPSRRNCRPGSSRPAEVGSRNG